MYYSYESTQLFNYTASGKFGQFNRYIGNIVDLNFSVILADIIDRFNFHNEQKNLTCFKKYLGKWFYYKVESCKERTCLSEFQQKRAIKILEKYQILVSKKIGMSSKRHIRLNIIGLNLFLLNPPKMMAYFEENKSKGIKDFCKENKVEYTNSTFNNDEILTELFEENQSMEDNNSALGTEETSALGTEETSAPIIMNPSHEPHITSSKEEEKKKTPPKKKSIKFNRTTNEFENITEEFLLSLEKDFPLVKKDIAFPKMINWLIDHKKSKGTKAFILRWFTRDKEYVEGGEVHKTYYTRPKEKTSWEANSNHDEVIEKRKEKMMKEGSWVDSDKGEKTQSWDEAMKKYKEENERSK